MTSTSFDSLGLSAPVLKALREMGFESPSPIQSATIPLLLAGRDVAGLSRTGSGKTAAFAVPALERINPSLRAPQVLILCPTRELAVQISGEVSKISAYKPDIQSLAIYGGASYAVQNAGLREGCQIIAGTPGRIMDHLERGSLRLQAVQMVILDEADRMLDMGFRDAIAAILEQVPAERQTAFFSATMPPSVEHLVRRYTREPEWIRLETRAEAAPDIEQVYYEVSHTGRVNALCRILECSDLNYGIIFCSTKSAVDGVSEHLMAGGYRADRLHGDMSQAMRERVLKRFRERKLDFLVATDVAARGIDVDDVEAVINYDMPRDSEDYVHRIGRTGRAGRSGKAITLATARETYALRRIQRMTRVDIRREVLPSAADASRSRARAITQKVLALLEAGTCSVDRENLAQLISGKFTSEAVVGALLHLLVHGRQAPTEAPARHDRAVEPRPVYAGKNASSHRPQNRPRERHATSESFAEDEDRRAPRDLPSRPPRGAAGQGKWERTAPRNTSAAFTKRVSADKEPAAWALRKKKPDSPASDSVVSKKTRSETARPRPPITRDFAHSKPKGADPDQSSKPPQKGPPAGYRGPRREFAYPAKKRAPRGPRDSTR